ncbi:CoA-binding protein [Chloroflexota bacterium]
MQTRPSVKNALDAIFPPRAIAIAGVSTNPGKHLSGREFLDALVDAGYQGKIYPVNPAGGEVYGRKLYTSIRDIPDNVDYVMSAVPARHNLQLLRDAAAKGARVVHIYSAGFSEIADPQGKKLEEELAAVAREVGIHVIGPNCMGVYSPKYGLSFRQGLPRTAGSLGFISQSGSNSFLVIRDGSLRGVHMSKLFSYGNAADLDECDILEYLAQDSETDIIGGYIEGVDDGRRFLQTLKKITPQKPVVLYKAGNTGSGLRAVSSHTGTLAGSEKIWQAALRQAGAVQVASMEELVDMVVLFHHMAPPRGTNTALFGVGGGAIVQSTDECAEAGLNLPLLPAETRRKLEELYTSETGGSFRNPIDVYLGKRDLIQGTVQMIAALPEIDLIMMQFLIGYGGRGEKTLVKTFLEAIVNLSKSISRRTAIVIRPSGILRFSQYNLKTQQKLVAAGYPVFESAKRAASAIVKYLDYHQRKARRK